MYVCINCKINVQSLCFGPLLPKSVRFVHRQDLDLLLSAGGGRRKGGGGGEAGHLRLITATSLSCWWRLHHAERFGTVCFFKQ